MDIIIPDIGKYIVDLIDLRSLANLLLVNKFFNTIISAKTLTHQWKHINSMKLDTIDSIFAETCKLGFLEYAKYLVNENKIDIHIYGDYVFVLICYNGHKDVARWLVELGESDGYTKIDIHANNDYAFRYSCLNGHKDVAQWLVELGESDGYTKIDIHAWNEYAFRYSCKYGHLDLAQWLINLGESSGYTKIDIHADNDYAFMCSCKYGHKYIARWLVQLSESGAYNPSLLKKLK